MPLYAVWLWCGCHWHGYALERPQKDSLDAVPCGLRQEYLISVVMITYPALAGFSSGDLKSHVTSLSFGASMKMHRGTRLMCIIQAERSHRGICCVLHVLNWMKKVSNMCLITVFVIPVVATCQIVVAFSAQRRGALLWSAWAQR